MADAQKVIVYVRSADAKLLKARGQDPKLWVRGVVKHMLEQFKEATSE